MVSIDRLARLPFVRSSSRRSRSPSASPRGDWSAGSRRSSHSLHADRVADGAARRRAGAARIARAIADGHAHRSVRRPRRCSPCCSSCPRWRRGVVPLTTSYRRCWWLGVLHRPRGIVVRDRRGVRVALDAAGTAGHGARRLRSRHARPVARGVRRRRCRRRAFGWQSGVSRHERRCCWSGPSSSCCSRATRRRGAAGRRRRDGARAARRADGVAARRVLLPDVRRLRRVLDLPADAAARAVRPRRRPTPDSAPRASSCSRR